MRNLLKKDMMKRLISLFILGVFLPCACISVVGYYFGKKALKEEVFNRLDSVKEGKTRQILQLLETRIANARLLTESLEMQKAYLRMEEFFADNRYEPDRIVYEEIYQWIDPFFKKQQDIYGLEDIYILSALHGNVLYSTGKIHQIGRDIYQESGLVRLYRNVIQKRKADMTDFSYYAPIEKPVAFIGAPVFDDGGEVVAVVAIQLGTERINRIMSEGMQMGKTDETYLVGQDLSLRSNSRLGDGSAILQKKIDTKATRDLLSQGEDKKIIRGYGGTKVLSCYSHVGLKDVLGADFDWGILSEMSASEAFAPFSRLKLQMIILAMFIAVFVCLSAYLTSRSVAMPLNKETNLLAASIEQILSHVGRLVFIAEETNRSLSEITSTVEELKQTAHLSYEKAEEVASTSLNVAETSEAGKKATEEVFSGMNRIKEEMESIAESIVKLSEQTQSIEEIINTVNDLSDQSNLLSVNASIEAARAGEYGKSFAVVAQEVKSLADQSTKATQQVKDILSEIQRATGKAVMSTERGNHAVEEGAALSGQAGEAIETLTESISRSAESATQIAATSKQQLIGTDQLVAVMEIIRESSFQNMSSIKELENATKDLEHLGSKLKDLAGPSSSGRLQKRGTS